MAFIEAFSKNADAVDNMKSGEKYREIKPETGITDKEVKDFWNAVFSDMEHKEAFSEEIPVFCLLFKKSTIKCIVVKKSRCVIMKGQRKGNGMKDTSIQCYAKSYFM